jgi:hypothetical protein
MQTYETTLSRAVLALVVGTIVGTIIVTLFAVLTDINYFREYGGPGVIPLVFIYAAFFWGAGLFLVAPLPWVILHRYHQRTWPLAVAFGIILTFVVVLGLMTYGFGLFTSGYSAADNGGPLWIDGRLTLHGWAEAAKVAAMCGVAGALVGLVVWRVAYRASQG